MIWKATLITSCFASITGESSCDNIIFEEILWGIALGQSTRSDAAAVLCKWVAACAIADALQSACAQHIEVQLLGCVGESISVIGGSCMSGGADRVIHYALSCSYGYKRLNTAPTLHFWFEKLYHFWYQMCAQIWLQPCAAPGWT